MDHKQASREKGQTSYSRDGDLIRCLPLHKAALEGDWESAKKFLDSYPAAVTAKMTDKSATALHIAVTGNRPMRFVEELVTRYADSLRAVDSMGNTALFYAAAAGNIEVVRFLVKKDPELTKIRGKLIGYTPLHKAAKNGRKDTVDFLLSVTSDEDPIFRGRSGFYLLKNLVNAGLVGIALDLLKKHSDLAQQSRVQKRVLQSLARKPSLFESGNQLGCLKRLIYQWIKIPKENSIDNPKDFSATSKNAVGRDIENPNDSPKDCSATSKNTFGTMLGKVCVMLKNTIKQLGNTFFGIEKLYETKTRHVQTLELVKIMLEKITSSQETDREKITSSPETARKCLEKPLFRAIEWGIHELVEEIIKTYSPSAFFLDEEKRNILQLAVLHRQVKVFSLIYHTSLYKNFMVFTNNKEIGILHLVEEFQPSSQVSGPALQMQRELQWLKAVETLVDQPSFLEEETDSPEEEKTESSEQTKEKKTETSEQTKKEKTGHTLKQLFTEKHADLAKKGEEWMKGIATSCTVVTALIVTMVFAAAFTVPGGNNSEGKPEFLHTPAFIIFAISDALALVFSTTSILMFLGILTARYLQEDFLESLPKKLILALISFFISITSVMVAFGAALYIVLFDISKLVILPIALLACLPVVLFVGLKFPLLLEVFRSTYRSKILRAVK